jgi:hypothetical protein
MEYAKASGLRGFTADVLCENKKMLAVFERSGCKITKKLASGAFEVVMLF